MPEQEKSGGKGILILGGLIVSGIIIALVLKSKPQLSPAASLIQQMQERINMLENQVRLNPYPSPAMTLEPWRQPQTVPELVQSYEPQMYNLNLIQYKDGSVTDADSILGGEKYKNKESWSIKRDMDGAIVGIDVERNASVGSNNGSAN